MTPLPVLSLSLALLLATVPTASFAQDQAPALPSAEAPATEVAPAEAEVLSPEEIAFNERSAALGQRVLDYDAQLKDAARLASLDAEGTRAALDTIQAAFQAEIDAFLTDLIDFAVWKEPSLTPEAREAQRRGIEGIVPQLASLPQAAHEKAEADARSPSATPD